MKCEKCGMEHEHIHDISGMRKCRDALAAQLAEARRELDAKGGTYGRSLVCK